MSSEIGFKSGKCLACGKPDAEHRAGPDGVWVDSVGKVLDGDRLRADDRYIKPGFWVPCREGIAQHQAYNVEVEVAR